MTPGTWLGMGTRCLAATGQGHPVLCLPPSAFFCSGAFQTANTCSGSDRGMRNVQGLMPALSPAAFSQVSWLPHLWVGNRSACSLVKVAVSWPVTVSFLGVSIASQTPCPKRPVSEQLLVEIQSTKLANDNDDDNDEMGVRLTFCLLQKACLGCTHQGTPPLPAKSQARWVPPSLLPPLP